MPKKNDKKMVIVQWPNKLLWTAFAALAVSWIFKGWIGLAGKVVYDVTIVIWALSEIKNGDSIFRKFLGAFVLIWVLFGLFRHT